MFCILIGGNTIARSDVIFVMTEKGLFIDNPTGDRVSVFTLKSTGKIISL